jgi:Type VI secretion system (T6SS), amidase effector protein 4
MKRTAKGHLPFDYDTLRNNYPTYNRLPKHIANYMDALNKNLPVGKSRHTPCCFQVSEALNLTGAEHAVPARSYRRANARLGLNHFLGAVDELEAHLTVRYGKGEGLHIGAGSGADRTKLMKAKIAGRKGLICFRDHGYGAHTELWDGSSIVQNGAPAANGAGLSGAYIWGQPYIWFWQATGEDDMAPAPAWLQGWWDVDDGNQWFYHVSDQFVVVWTTTEPKGVNDMPLRNRGNEGVVQLDETTGTIEITWDENGGANTVETFSYAPNSAPVNLSGKSNRFANLTAVRKVTWGK